MKKILRAIQVVLCIVAAPPALYSLFYANRFILTGQWVQGGGERAFFGFMLAAGMGCVAMLIGLMAEEY